MMNKELWHYTASYILNPQHPVTIQVIGAGGNGSQVLSQLARINQALIKLGHPGLYVTCFDPDKVTEANLGRQLFSPADLGKNKAAVLITRLNQFFGTCWSAMPVQFSMNVKKDHRNANITISCVDTIKARKTVQGCLYKKQGLVKTTSYLEPFQEPYYWMDLGNSANKGQFVIGSCCNAKQPKTSAPVKTVNYLKNVFEKFPDFENQKTKDTGPSCSLAEALKKQDLFVNSFLVQAAMTTLWKMFREGKIDYHGAFINLETLDIAKIKL